MPAEHLIPTLKTVERGGKSHQQIYWTKAAELRAAVAAKGFKAADQFGGDSAKYGKYIDSWSGSSNTNLAGEWRGVVGKAMGLTPAEMEGDRKYLQDKNYSAVASLDKGYAYAHDSQAVRSVVACAAVAQSMYEKPTVTLYRGIHSAQASQVKADLAGGQAHVDVNVGSIASWSESYDVAKNFSGGHGGVVMKLEVPREAILASWRVPGTPLAGTVDSHLGGEQEVLFASKGTVRIAAVDARDGGLPKPASALHKDDTHAAAKAQLAAAKNLPEAQAAKTAAQKQAEVEQVHEKQGKKYLDEMIAAASPGHPRKAESDALHQKWQEHKAQIGITYPAPGQKEKFYADQKQQAAPAPLPPAQATAPAPNVFPSQAAFAKPSQAGAFAGSQQHQKNLEVAGLSAKHAELAAIPMKASKTGKGYVASQVMKWADKHHPGVLSAHLDEKKGKDALYQAKLKLFQDPSTPLAEKQKMSKHMAGQLLNWKEAKAQQLAQKAKQEIGQAYEL